MGARVRFPVGLCSGLSCDQWLVPLVTFREHSLIVRQLAEEAVLVCRWPSQESPFRCVHQLLAQPHTVLHMRLRRGVYVPYRKVVAGALASPPEEIVSDTGRGREASLFQSSQDSNPGPCCLSPGSSHRTSVEASSSHWHNCPRGLLRIRVMESLNSCPRTVFRFPAIFL